jgi:hypothetical protein
MQFPNRTLLPKSPFIKGGLPHKFPGVPLFYKGGQGGLSGYPERKNLFSLLQNSPVTTIVILSGAKNLVFSNA